MLTSICPCVGTVATFAIIVSFLYNPSAKIERISEIHFSFAEKVQKRRAGIIKKK